MMSLSNFVLGPSLDHTLPVEDLQIGCPLENFKAFAKAHLEKESENMPPDHKLQFMNKMQQILSAMGSQLIGLIQLVNNPRKFQKEHDLLKQYFIDSATFFKRECETYQHEVQSVMKLINTTRDTLLNTPAPVFGSFTPKSKKGSDKPPLPYMPSYFDVNTYAVKASSDAQYVYPSDKAEYLYESVTKFHQWFQETLSSMCGTIPDYELANRLAATGYGNKQKYPKLCRIVKACLPDSLRPKTALVLRSHDHLERGRSFGPENFEWLTFQRINARYNTHQRFFHDEETFCDAVNKVTTFSGPIDLLVIRTHGTWLSFNPSSDSAPIYSVNREQVRPFRCLNQLVDKATVVIDSGSSGMGKELIISSMANRIMFQSPPEATVYAPTEPSYGFTLQDDEFKFLSVKNPGRDITYKTDFSSFCDKHVEWINQKDQHNVVQTEYDALMRDVDKIIRELP